MLLAMPPEMPRMRNGNTKMLVCEDKVCTVDVCRLKWRSNILSNDIKLGIAMIRSASVTLIMEGRSIANDPSPRLLNI